MTADTPDALDAALESFKAKFVWHPDATELEKALVVGNLNGFVAHLRQRRGELTALELGAAVRRLGLAGR